jgi:hypothetical protein
MGTKKESVLAADETLLLESDVKLDAFIREFIELNQDNPEVNEDAKALKGLAEKIITHREDFKSKIKILFYDARKILSKPGCKGQFSEFCRVVGVNRTTGIYWAEEHDKTRNPDKANKGRKSDPGSSDYPKDGESIALSKIMKIEIKVDSDLWERASEKFPNGELQEKITNFVKGLLNKEAK